MQILHVSGYKIEILHISKKQTYINFFLLTVIKTLERVLYEEINNISYFFAKI